MSICQHDIIHADPWNPDFTTGDLEFSQFLILFGTTFRTRPNREPIRPSPAKVARRFEVTAGTERVDLLGHLLLVRYEEFRNKKGGCKHRRTSRTELPS